eukprot:1838475-Prymnesium_polylepis.1
MMKRRASFSEAALRDQALRAEREGRPSLTPYGISAAGLLALNKREDDEELQAVRMSPTHLQRLSDASRAGSGRLIRNRGESVLELQPHKLWAASLISTATGHHDIHEKQAAKEAAPAGPQTVVLFTDLGGGQHDCGDTVALFMMRGLEGLGFLRTAAVMVSAQSQRGLELAVKTAATALSSLGFEDDVPIGVCQDAPQHAPDSFQLPNGIGSHEVLPMSTLLEGILEEADDLSVALALTT